LESETIKPMMRMRQKTYAEWTMPDLPQQKLDVGRSVCREQVILYGVA